MAQVEPAAGIEGGGGPNRRLFLIIVLGLVGLLLLGAIAIAAIWGFSSLTKPPVTATVVAKALATSTRTLPTATATPTVTETPAPTNTSVFQAPPAAPTGTPGTTGGGGALTPTATNTVTGTPEGGLPTTGLGEDLLLLAGGVVLVFIIIAARRARAVGTAA